jgi:ribosomal protein S12 methylthiotransferase
MSAFLLIRPEKVDEKTKKQRRAKLMKEQAKISRRKNKTKVGKTYKVLFEGVSQESDLLWQGRTEGQAAEIDGYILINDAPDNFTPEIGGFYEVEITEAHDYDLIGRIV